MRTETREQRNQRLKLRRARQLERKAGFEPVPSPRHTRRVHESEGAKVYRGRGKVLDAINETIDDGFIHPTKGRRRVTLKRSRAALIAEEIKAGQRRRISLKKIRQELNS